MGNKFFGNLMCYIQPGIVIMRGFGIIALLVLHCVFLLWNFGSSGPINIIIVLATNFMVAIIGPLATISCEPRQARKGAAAAVNLCAGVWLVVVTTSQHLLIY